MILNNETFKVFNSLDVLVQNPNTLLALQDLGDLLRSAAPLFTYLNPYQSVCNYATYFFGGLSSHISEGSKNGTAEQCS